MYEDNRRNVGPSRAAIPAGIYRGFQLLFLAVVGVLVWEIVEGAVAWRVTVLLVALAIGLSALRRLKPR